MEHVISIEEELPSRKDNAVRTEAGETNGSRSQPATVIEEANIDSKVGKRKKLNPEAMMFWKLNVLRDKMQNEAEPTKPKIQKVSLLLQGNQTFKKHYEPRVVSFGPIHHGKKKYELAEKWKLILAYKFIKDIGKGEKDLYEKIAGSIDKLRKCFDQEVTRKYDDKELAPVLFVDGCSILQFIYYCTQKTSEDLNKIKKDQVAIGRWDLFLLENQVPYQLLEDLMELSEKKEELKKAIVSFVHKAGGNEGKINETKPIHLLDLLRTNLLEPEEGKEITESLLEPEEGKETTESEPNYSYRNVQELRAAGIQLRCNKKSGLKKVSFTKLCSFFPGYLHLPQITVDDSTAPKLLNLIAYEMCPDFDNDFGITSYVSFLESLIDNRDDVKELRKAHILYNSLGSDKEVAKLFNEISTDLVPNPKIYSKVKEDIQIYYDNQFMTSLAEGWRNYFGSPWAFLALLGVLIGLGLTAVQTWYTVNSSSTSLGCFPRPLDVLR